MIEDAAVAIIAGGRGTRLGGTNKALLEIEGRPLLALQLEVLRWSFREILIVASDPKPFEHLGFPVVPDLIAGRGAPGGVHAALAAARASWTFCLACDMPFPKEAAILHLASLREGVQAVVPVRAGRPEPLFAFYAKGCARPFAERLRDGEPSLRELIALVPSRMVSEEELAAVDPGLSSLENINTPDDLLRFSKRR